MQHRLSGADRKAIAATLKADIDAACVASREGYRDHLGASEIGEPCARRLVYAFRWMHREQLSGRMMRLFSRGHFEEPRILGYLQNIGCVAQGEDENGKQFRMGAGHYGGSLDGKVWLPERYGLSFPFLLEMKTHNIKSFTKLIKEGVRASKPKHFSQMCAYGQAYDYAYAIYFAVCKNDDEIHIEIVEIDHEHGRELERKAVGRIIRAVCLPSKIAASSAYAACKYCPMVPVCHEGAAPDVNCRSCANSIPEHDGTWRCRHWNATIPKDAIPHACPHWEAFS